MCGTSTDIGVLLQPGLTRLAAAYVPVGGVNVNCARRHLHSIGLGDRSIVQQAASDGQVIVGLASVGSKFQRRLIFGGTTTMATNIAVAGGRAHIDAVPVIPASVDSLDKSLVNTTLARIKAMLRQVIDEVKTSPQPLSVLLTGGGFILALDIIESASEVIRPPFFDVANAVGATCSGVGVAVDMIHSTSERSAAGLADEVKKLAIDRAVAQGAGPDSVYIAQLDAITIPYLDNRKRYIVTTIGDLDLSTTTFHKPVDEIMATGFDDVEDEQIFDNREQYELRSVAEEAQVDIKTHTPTVVRDKTTGVAEWHLTKTDIDSLADGCYLLECGGGGNPNAGRLQLRDMLDAGHRIRVIDPTGRVAVADDARVYWGGHMGSLSAISEHLMAHETVLAIRALMGYLRHDDLDSVVGIEFGGLNGLEPLLWGSSLFFDRPVLDADFMGRANPMCWQITLTVYQPGQFCPYEINAGTGHTLLLTRAPKDEDVDRPLRGALSELGSLVGLEPAPTTGSAVRQFAV
ncbi:hypothetical protein Sste5346_002177 [Sporothrix stenoceras]|uniref:S-Me-THD N-terminal domain-containing protein n=1 Tax=Sporothrix stenoceras TaxID=5173 RepID=A0ABR3ZM48_9PEZI